MGNYNTTPVGQTWWQQTPLVQTINRVKSAVNPAPVFNAPYGLNPTSQQQQNIVTYSPLSSGAKSPIYAPTTSSGSVQGATTTGGTNAATQQLQAEQNFETQNLDTGPSAEEQLRSELDAIFSPVFSALQGQENTLRENYAPVEGQITTEYQNAGANLAQQKESSLTDLGTQEKQAGTRQTDALTAATRLYNELTRGGQQRFGGASSAGEAFNALTSVEQQRRQATIGAAYETAMQQIGTFKTQLNQKYDLAVKDLDAQKASAIIAAQQDFRDKLQAIQTAKATAESDKATATMNTLQDYRNKIYTINLQNLQFMQTLAANKDTALSTVDNYLKQFAQSVAGGSNVLVQNPLTNYQPTTNYGVSSPTMATNTPQTGQISTGKRWDEATQQWI